MSVLGIVQTSSVTRKNLQGLVKAQYASDISRTLSELPATLKTQTNFEYL